MPEQPDEDLVPPLKVMRKRLNGVYRADSGFNGPTRRYVLIVALLVGLASLPTLAAITAGSSELADGKTDTMDIPLLPPASPGPIRGASPPDSRVGSSPSSTPSAAPSAVPDLGTSGVGAAPPPVAGVAGAAVRAGRLVGQAGERRPLRGSGPSSSTGSVRREQGDVSGYAGGERSGSGGATGSDKPSARPGEAAGAEEAPSMVAFPALPGMPAVPRLPAVGGRSAHPHSDSNDLSDIDDSDSPDPSDSPDDSDSPGPASSESPGSADQDGPDEGPAHRRLPDRPGDSRCEQQVIVNRRRSTDRSEHSRRKAVVDRPQNIRPASILERSYAPGGQNIRRLIPEARIDDNRIATGSYRGSHRAGSMHHADDTPAQRRSSRVGRHHAEPTEDLTGHW